MYGLKKATLFTIFYIGSYDYAEPFDIKEWSIIIHAL